MVRIPVTKASTLDWLWGMFLATGDEVPVRRIMAIAGCWRGAKGDPRDTRTIRNQDGSVNFDQVVASAALWSLNANTRQHERVARIVAGSDPLAVPGDLKFPKKAK